MKGRAGILAVILGLALAIRIAWIFWLPSIPVSDFGWYYDRARSILAGTGFSIDGRPTAQFPPGYPYFLALLIKLTGSLAGVKLAQAVIGTFTCYLIYRFGSLLGGPRAGVVAGTLSAIYPNFIFYSNLLASENLFIPLLLGGFIVLLDDTITSKTAARTALAGFIFGIASLTRPAILFVPGIVFLWLFVKRTGLVKAVGLTALLGTIMLAVIIPWTIRNYVALGGLVVVSSNGGEVFWMGNNSRGEGGRWYPPGNPVEKIHGEVARSNAGYKLALADISAHKLKFVNNVVLKFPRFFRPPDGLAWNILDSKDHDWTKENLSTPFFIRPIHGLNTTFPFYRFWLGRLEHVLWLSAGLGALLLARRKRGLVIPMLYVCWFAFHLLFAFGHPRFVMPHVAFNLALAAVCLVELPGLAHKYAATWRRFPFWVRLISVPDSAVITAALIFAIALVQPQISMGQSFAPNYQVGIFLVGSMVISSIVTARQLWLSSSQTPPSPQ